MANQEHLTNVIALIDVDGTTSDTARHMQGFNERLVEAFPVVADALPHIRAQRRAFRAQHKELSFAQQDAIWQQQYPGTSSHSQLDIYRTFAPEIFDKQLTAEVETWLQRPEHFGHAEYEDTAPMLSGLRRIGALPVLFTLGQKQTANGGPGWQQLKAKSAPHLSQLDSRIVEDLPAGGKGQLISDAYNISETKFRFKTDSGLDVISPRAVMIDDSVHNMELPPEAHGILIDRHGKYEQANMRPNVSVVRSLVEVPDVIQAYMQ